MSTSPSVPPLDAGDCYVYAHSNGAITIVHADGRPAGATLDDASAEVERTGAIGGRVVVGGDDAPLSVTVLTHLGTLGVPLEPFGAPQAPRGWPAGADALIVAAKEGDDRILDDLVARGADVHHRADDGSTALHYAAAHGHAHAVDALVAGGARLDVVNRRGATPLRLAEGRGHPAVADRLRSLGASTVVTPGPVGEEGPTGPGPDMARIHAGVLYVWLYPVVVAAIVLALARPPLAVVAVVAVVGVALYALVAPWPLVWAGAVPRRIDGAVLHTRRASGRRFAVDLDRVSIAAFGGSQHRSGFHSARWLLLEHPDGVHLPRWAWRLLLIPDGELELVRDRFDRVIVIPIDGPKKAEVLVPVADRLARRSVPLSPSLAVQVADARAAG